MHPIQSASRRFHELSGPIDSMGDPTGSHEPYKPSKTVLHNVNVFNGTDFCRKLVIIDDDKIADKIGAAPHGPKFIDCNGGFLIPGLIDSHVHVSALDGSTAKSKENMETLRQYGITTCLDMECQPPDLLKSLRKLPGLPDLYSAGYAASFNRKGNWPLESHVETPEAAELFVAKRVAEGDDFIKMIADPPRPEDGKPPKRGLDVPTMRKLVDTAKECGLLSIAHAMTPPGIIFALDAGVDIVTHAPLAEALDGGQKERSVVVRIVKDGRICVPTLTMMEGTAQNLKPPKNYDDTKRAVRTLHELGAPILAGTDCNSLEGFVPFAPEYGKSLHHELKLLVEVGLSNLEALRAATVLPARYFRLPDRGSIEPGKRADLVLLSQNPLTDIENTKSIRKVWLAGLMFEPPPLA